MLSIFRQHVQDAIDDLHKEADRRRESTPSDVAAEAFDFAARRMERALAEADRETVRISPTRYAELHGVTPQTVTRWIRAGELAAEQTATGYLIARDAVRVVPIRQPQTEAAS